MGWYARIYGTAGPGIPENEKKPSGLPLFFRTLGREWRSLIKLNGIFLLHCLPVITIPAAVCAMQHLTLRMIQDKPLLLWTDYRIAFRSLFKRASLLGWPYLTLAAACAVCLFVYWQFALQYTPFLVLYAVCAVFALLLGLAGTYFFSLTARTDAPASLVFKNSLLMGLAYFPHSLPVFLANAALFFLCAAFWLLAWPVIFCFLFSLQSLICAFAAWPDMLRQQRLCSQGH